MRQLALVVVVSACGVPDFSGTWRGTVTADYVCNGQSQSNATGIEWLITQEGSTLSITPDGGSCGALAADIGSTGAEIRSKTCPAGSLESGTITLETATRLKISTRDSLVGKTTTCVGGIAGELERAP